MQLTHKPPTCVLRALLRSLHSSSESPPPPPPHIEEDTTAQLTFLSPPSLTCPCTAIQCVHMLDISRGESPSVPKLTWVNSIVPWQNGGATITAEGCGTVMHYRSVVIAYALGCGKASADFVKLVLQT